MISVFFCTCCSVYQKTWSSSIWPQAKHLHTSAERAVSPNASLSPLELLSDLFTCSAHAAQAKRTRRIRGAKMEGGVRGTGDMMRREGTEKVINTEDEERHIRWLFTD